MDTYEYDGDYDLEEGSPDWWTDTVDYGEGNGVWHDELEYIREEHLVRIPADLVKQIYTVDSDVHLYEVSGLGKVTGDRIIWGEDGKAVIILESTTLGIQVDPNTGFPITENGKENKSPT